MKPNHSRRVLVALVLGAVLAAATGCLAFPKVHQTHITVQCGSDQVLHLAIVPRELPDGSQPTEQLAQLLEEVAERAGGYTYIEKVVGGWLPPGQKEVVQEINDLLLVQGPPGLAGFLKRKLHEDFGQQYPFVVSLPVQQIVTVQAVPAEQQRRQQ